MRLREELENFINASDIFSIDREKDGEFYISEERKFIEYIWLYLKSIGDYTSYGVEIIDTVKLCLKSFRPEFGKFLNYYNKSLKRNIEDTKNRERKIQFNTVYGDEIIKNKEGVDNITIFSTIASKDKNIQEITEQQETERDIVRVISRFYNIQRPDSLPLLSKMLTAWVLTIVSPEALSEAIFINTEVLELYYNKHKSLTSREIAGVHGVNESQASRTINRFIERLKSNSVFLELLENIKR